MTETWVFNEAPSVTGSAKVWSVNFVSNGQAFTELTRTTRSIRYRNETVIAVYTVRTATWSDENYRTVTFEEAPSGTLLEWLTVAATKVPAKRINRVDLNGETVLDLTADTVTPETLDAGVTAHNAAGEIITGTRVPIATVNGKAPDDSGNVEIVAADVPYSSGPAATVKSVLDGKQTATQSLTAEKTLADDDSFPFYDASASTNRKTLWSNIVAKLKKLFLPLAGGTVSGNVNIVKATDAYVSVRNSTDDVGCALEAFNNTVGLYAGHLGKWLIRNDGTTTTVDNTIPATAGAVKTTNLADKAVTAAKIADKTITGGNIADGTLTREKMAADAFTLADNAGAHNAVYRGKNLGSAVTTAQWAAIQAGTFKDLFIGDYWEIGGVNWRIAAFDYYYNTGDVPCTTHHVVIVPDLPLYNNAMNDTNTTVGAYVGSKMYTEGLNAAKTTINNAFGSAHILNHRQYLKNAVTGNYESGGSWYDSAVELMTEQNVYGGKIFTNCLQGENWARLSTIDKSQFPLFAHRPDMISNGPGIFLRDVASSETFCYTQDNGAAEHVYASTAHGVRPAFSIKA